MRCEAWVKFHKRRWKQCGEEAIFMVTVEQENVEGTGKEIVSEPSCQICLAQALESDELTIISKEII